MPKGNSRYEFYAYNTSDNTWATRESIPAIGRSGKKKSVKKGSAIAAQGGKVYAFKGGNTVEFWRYEPTGFSGSGIQDLAPYPWTQLADVPTGAKMLREGAGAAVVQVGDSSYLFLLKGSNTTEFYRYSMPNNTWQARTSAPRGVSGKSFKNGSALCASEDGRTLYALKAGYNEFFTYLVDSDAWFTKASLPLLGSIGKKKKVGAGAGLAYHNGYIYALKGNNTSEFWQYAADSGKWLQLPDVPFGSGKYVKGGGALTYGGKPTPALYGFKGNKTFDFFRYGLSPYGSRLTANSSEALSGSSSSALRFALRIAPNTFTGRTTLLYSLPSEAPVSLAVYDVSGRVVREFVSGTRAAGNYTVTWNGRDGRGQYLARGIYFCRLNTGKETMTRKLILE
jgi:hypothetical protein